MLLQDDPAIFYINFHFIPLSNIEIAPQFNRKNDSSQFIYFSNHTGRLHMYHPFSHVTMSIRFFRRMSSVYDNKTKILQFIQGGRTLVLSWLVFLLFFISVFAGILQGSMDAVSTAMLDGASSAITLGLSLAGPISLWSALQSTMERSGISNSLAKTFSPLLRFLFPQSAKDPIACSAISQNLTANLLGLGNAATPMGIRAIQRMQQLSGSHIASNEMCRLIVMNTASIQFIPTTVAAARASLGAPNPYNILPAVWISSILSVAVGLAAARCMERWSK